MQTRKIFFYLVLLLMQPVSSGAEFLEPIVDANSITKIVERISNLTEGGIFNITFKSKIDGTFQPMLVKIPGNYTKEKSWPLLVVLHGLRDNPIIVPTIKSMVQVGPFGRGDLMYRDIGEKDVFECIGLARDIFNIDAERIYLCGFSMGGSGTFDLGLKYPDFWAACVPVCGRCSQMDLIENGRNLAFWINTGSEDKIVSPEDSTKAYNKAIELGFKKWKYTEYEQMGHSFWIDWEKVGKWLLEQKRHRKASFEDPNNIVANRLNQQIILDKKLANIVQKYPELCQLIEVWPNLPADLRSKIINLAKKTD